MNIVHKDGTESVIQFKWDMDLIGLAHLYAPDGYAWQSEYCGAVFFGDFKLEFIRNECNTYCNLYQYGAEDIPGSAYAYLPNNVPYEEREELAEQIEIPDSDVYEYGANTDEHMNRFCTDIEIQICALLCRNMQYMPIATVPTEPDKWYPVGSYYHIKEITREA